ncbi:hypothetical protein HanRHA438_Chr04g0161101 [Helianthus annuus]|nr:hypothetical protein HanRHA438_Chr04g0161101 [Helianthus annuus]
MNDTAAFQQFGEPSPTGSHAVADAPIQPTPKLPAYGQSGRRSIIRTRRRRYD